MGNLGVTMLDFPWHATGAKDTSVANHRGWCAYFVSQHYWPGNFRETLGCPGATTARGCRHGVWLFDMPHFRKRISTWGPRIRSSRSVSAESVYGTFVLPVEAVALASHNILVGAVRTAATVLATANLLDDNGAIAALVDVDDFFASVG
jgi:hypothetical protein